MWISVQSQPFGAVVTMSFMMIFFAFFLNKKALNCMWDVLYNEKRYGRFPAADHMKKDEKDGFFHASY